MGTATLIFLAVLLGVIVVAGIAGAFYTLRERRTKAAVETNDAAPATERPTSDSQR